MLYYNLQPKLTKKSVNKTTPNLNIYRALEFAAPVHLYLHTYQYRDNVDQILAFALTTGCEVTLDIESIDEVIHFSPYKNIRPAMYRFENKEHVYNYIKETLANHKAEIYRVDQEINTLRESNKKSKYFQVTPEIEQFIKTYAPAYGLPVPKFHTTETTSDSYQPKHWNESYYKILGINHYADQPAVSNPAKTLAKWDDTERRSKAPTPLHQIEAIFDSLMYYTRNNIPFDDNYTTCPQCGNPMRTNPYGMTEFNEFDVCLDCDPDPNRETSYHSFNEAYMNQTI